jgi:hypothetical protein
MVHALEKCHTLLKLGGCLVDIHALTNPPLIEIQSEDVLINAGTLLDSSNFQRYRQAFEAIETVVEWNLFELELKRSAGYQIFIDSYSSFQDWLADQWDTSYLSLETNELIKDSMSASSSASRLVVSKKAQVTLLRAL